MNGRRERTVLASAWLMALVASGGCEARSSMEAAQTAVVAAQTVLPGAQTSLQGIVAGLLAGARLDVNVSPDGVPNADVTTVSVEATDTGGRLAQLDTGQRSAAVTAALAAIAGYYPNATITLRVVDGSGTTLVSGTKPPGAPPAVQ